MGTGAFSTASVSRKVNIAVSPDDEALLALQPTSPDGTVQIEDGVLTIDTGAGDADGINPYSQYTFGSWNQAGTVTQPVLQIRNQSRVRQDIEVTYDWDVTTVGESVLTWYFSWKSGTNTQQDTIVVSDSAAEDSVGMSNISVGGAVNVAFQVDAANPGDVLSGEIELESSDSNI